MIWLALVASGLLGVSDFLGGVLSRRAPLLTVLVVSQSVATLTLLPQAALGGVRLDDAVAVGWGVVAGVATAVGIGALYAALAAGTMGVIAPITALSVLVPVGAGVLAGERVGVVVGVALVVAVLGTVLASGPEVRGASGHGLKPVVLAVVAAGGIGTINLALARGSVNGVTTPVLVAAVVTLLLYALAAMVRRERLVRLRGRALAGVAAIGVIGMLANICFSLASQSGALTVVAVLAALYPVATALLGWRLLGEHLQPVQVAGVGAVLVGVAMVAAVS